MTNRIELHGDTARVSLKSSSRSPRVKWSIFMLLEGALGSIVKHWWSFLFLYLKCKCPRCSSLLSSVQVTPSYQPVKQTTCRTRATARSPPAPVSVQSTPCRLPGLTTGVVAAATGPVPLLLLVLPQLLLQLLLRLLRAQQQRMHT